MNVLDRIKDWLINHNKGKLSSKFLQYHHIGICKKPCNECSPRDKRIYENGNHVKLPAHMFCDCEYSEVEEQLAGNISKKGITAPDVYLKAYGKLPDYYITKDEAIHKYGWHYGKDLSRLVPGKMIGGDIYRNDLHILPEKNGRIWYECDVDYTNGKRNALRLFYSNDGLMFYSNDHLEGNVTVVFIY